MIIYKKSAVDEDANIVLENEELPYRIEKTKTEPLLVSQRLWMPYSSYEKLRDFIYSREMNILQDKEDLGSLFSVLQWVNNIENQLIESKESEK